MSEQQADQKMVYPTGAIREVKTGKGRYDLIPWDAFQSMDTVFECVGAWIVDGSDGFRLMQEIVSCITEESFGDYYGMLFYLAEHYETGAIAHGVDNWKKGIPYSSFLDSGLRHYTKAGMGLDDENHAIAAIWNFLGLAWSIKNKPEMDDIHNRGVKNGN